MAKFAANGGELDEAGYTRLLDELVTEGVSTRTADHWKVVDPGAADMSVDVTLGAGFIEEGTTYGYPAWSDADENLAVTAADATNPRWDIVVAYIDLAVMSANPLDGTDVNNADGVVFDIVDGTPAGSPADPSDAAIQSAVGAANPWIKLARLRVAALSTTVTDSVIDDLRTPVAFRDAITAITTATTLGWGHKRVSATNAITLTLPNAALQAGGKVTVVNADTALKTIATQSSQTIEGDTADYLPNQYDRVTYISDGTNWQIDSERRNPLLAGAYRTSSFATTSASAAQITDMAVNPYIPAGNRRVRIVLLGTNSATVSGGTGNVNLHIYDGAIGGTDIGNTLVRSDTAHQHQVETKALDLAAGNAKTFRGGIDTSAGTITLSADANRPIKMEAILL